MISSRNDFDLGIKWRFPDARRYAFVFLALFGALILIYANSFDNSFHFDDTPNIVTNPNVHPDSLSWEAFSKSFYGIHLNHEQIKRPLSYLTLAVNHYFSGKNVFSYHAVNFAIHLITSVFLFLLIYNSLRLPLLRDRYSQSDYAIALLAVFFWATHPIQLTAVTYIVQRMAGLAGMFYVMAMYLYLKARTTPGPFKRVILFGLCTVAALLAFASKENAAMLPVTLFLFDLFLIQGVSRENLKKAALFAVVPVLIFAALAVFYVDLSSFLSGYEGRPFTLAQRLMTEPRVVMLYVSLLVYPVSSRLMLIHDIPLSYSLVDPWTTLASILVIAGVLAAALYYSRKYPLIAFCVIFFFINHVIESSIIPLELVYEHRNYIPSMFFFVLAAVVMVRVIDYFSYRPSIQFIMAFSFCFLLAAQAHTTYIRNETWQNEILLWSDNAAKAPNLSRTHTNLGRAYVDLGIESEAIKHFKEALELKRMMRKDDLAILLHNAAVANHHEGNDQAAINYLQKSLEVRSDSEDTLALLCQLYLEKGMLKKAYNELQGRVIDAKRIRSTKLLTTYALVMLHAGRLGAAMDLAGEVLKKKPGHPKALAILARSFEKKKAPGNAKWYWRRFLEKRPGSLKAHLALIELYNATNAIQRLEKTVGDLFCLSRDKSLCGIIENLGEGDGLNAVYTPDLKRIREAIEKVMLQEGGEFMNCGGMEKADKILSPR